MALAAPATPLNVDAAPSASHIRLASRRRDQGLVERIRGLLRDLDRHVPDFGEVASEMAMSQRTLRRRLNELDTSYGEILRDVRLRRAAECLLDPTLTVDGIAERLGYTEAANFRHAFRRWVGCSPQDFRRQYSASGERRAA